MSPSCATCARRSELLMRLGTSLDFRARDPARLWDTLALSDEQLIAALGGRKREQLSAWHATAANPRASEQPSTWRASAPGPLATQEPSGVERLCRHRAGYPSALRRRQALAPHELHIAGGAGRLRELLDGPVLAIVGTRRCTDYGLEVARGLGRDLAAAGVCVIGELCEGIAHGAHVGALEGGGPAVAVAAGGLDRSAPRSCATLCEQLKATGCVVSELPCGAPARIWSALARSRTVVLLAQIVIFVEAECGSRELTLAQQVRELGRPIGAVPGRVTSTQSQGTNGLLRDGARLVQGAQDALDLLYGAHSDQPARCNRTGAARAQRLDRRLRELVRMIGEGRDTLAKLSHGRDRPDAVLRELAELEIKGLVRRGDGGRYVPGAI